MEAGQTNYPHILLKAEEVEDNVYRIQNQGSHQFLHCNGGRGNVYMRGPKHPTYQLFRLIPTGVADHFQLQSYNMPTYKMYSDKSGTGNVWMTASTADRAGGIFKFVAK